jgi:ATP-dependent RNA helicase DDX52/ROK1
MDDLFNLLSSAARIDKSKRKKRSRADDIRRQEQQQPPSDDDDDEEEGEDGRHEEGEEGIALRSRDRTGKRDTSPRKLEQVHREQVTAFRRSVNIRLANEHDATVPDPLTSFSDIETPAWWKVEKSGGGGSFRGVLRAVLRNVGAGRWKEPTPIQMQSVPALLRERRDVIGAAPTGSGKSGAFIIPAVFLCSAPFRAFYHGGSDDDEAATSAKKKRKKRGKKDRSPFSGREGEIRSLLLAPSLELAAQLHREVERLGAGKPGGLHALLLSRSNAAQVIAGTAGGRSGVDVLVSTPLRLVDSIRRGLRLQSVRMVVLDEADRLLDASDGKILMSSQKKSGGDDDDGSEDDESDDDEKKERAAVSSSSATQSFLSQMDVILSEIPATAVRGLFSATVTPAVRSLSESILRNPVDITIAKSGTLGGANLDIEQELLCVGQEEGKLLAIRQIVQRGELRPPVIIFLQSQERAQALFGELLYDGIHVDVIHAGRSKAARERAVARFRKGETWVLICTDLMARGVDFRAVNMVINYDLPSSGVSYVHRIGRTGRAGRKGKAITLFTEADFENLRAIANVMKQSGCDVPEWMLNLKKKRPAIPPRRRKIDTTPSYDKVERHKKWQMIQDSKKKRKVSKSEKIEVDKKA